MCRTPHRAGPARRIARARGPDRSRSQARSGGKQERHRRAPAAPDTAPRAAARAQPATRRRAAARGSIRTAACRIVAWIEAFFAIAAQASALTSTAIWPDSIAHQPRTSAMLPEQKLDALIARHHTVEAELSTQVSPDTYVKLSREFAELGPIIETIQAYRGVAAEMRTMANGEKPALEERRVALEQQIKLALLPKDAMDERNVIVEIRAGTGGDEASLFAGDLFRMYERFAAKQGWKVELVSASDGSMGGYKEVIAEIRGRGAFAKLKFESGVHRVQRVPDTEGSGRIHTSTATVAVLPEAEDVDIAINEADLKIDTLRAGGAGGQHVNKTESAVRVTHLPTGIVVMMQEDRSQHRNRAKAMAVLRARLYDHQRQKQDAARAAERRGQVGSGDRSERIRTYNFPQGRVSDHRINLTLYKLPQIIEGEALGEIIDALVTEHQAELLAEAGSA